MTKLQRAQYQSFPFHLVTPSPWPLYTAFSLMSLALSLAMTMHGFIGNFYVLLGSIILVLYSMTLWFRDIIAEGVMLGDHTVAVKRGLNQGFLWFALTEALIFASLFWAYFHSAMAPTLELGSVWPPIGLTTIGPTELPLLNTIILLASGATITYCHHAVINGDRNGALIGLGLSFWLIVIFVGCQWIEYTNAPFTLASGIYGTVFFSTTGLHFFHMIMLAIMLAVCYWRMRNYHFTTGHHVFLECTIIYLHVLDILWLFIYIICYWWGS